jgi:NADPH2:quinone reductase
MDLVTQVKDLTDGHGVAVAFDHLGAVGWEASLHVLDKGGRYVTCGATTGASPKAGITRIFWKQLSMLGSTMASYGEFSDMLAFVEKNRITPRVDRVFNLSEVARAHERLEGAQQIGKIVLAVTGQSSGH